MEFKSSLKPTDVIFYVEGKEVLFKLFHDIEQHGMSLEVMLRHWLNHSKTYTAESFRDFLVANIPAVKCFTDVDQGD
ncbi:MAG: hypothetical protein ACTHLE_12725 [Agriterribacter sp.]